MEINVVTGGTGFLGKYLVRRLLGSGKNVWAIVRPINGFSVKERSVNLLEEFSKKYPSTFNIVEGDVTKDSLGINPRLLNDLSGKKVVFWHLAANLSFSVKDKDKVINTNQVGTINTVNLVNKIADKYIHISTAYVCGDTKGIFHEKDLDVGQKFRNYYESSKFEAEKYVRNNCKIPYVIFRPSIIMGDAYEGKAEGCTFGYYRFAYMFFIFKNWLVDKLQDGSFLTRKLLITLGTKCDKQNGFLFVPWLILPYTPTGTVDMVPVDYVIENMLKNTVHIPNKGKTIHLTNPSPPTFKFASSCLVNDLGYREVKFFSISPVLLSLLIKTLYFILPQLRIKLRSALWYLPYISRRYFFSQENDIADLHKQIFITKEFLNRINTYAKKEIFNKINME